MTKGTLGEIAESILGAGLVHAQTDDCGSSDHDLASWEAQLGGPDDHATDDEYYEVISESQSQEVDDGLGPSDRQARDLEGMSEVKTRSRQDEIVEWLRQSEVARQLGDAADF